MSDVHTSTLGAWLRGVGLWTPAYPDLESYLAAGAPEIVAPVDGEIPRPKAGMLPPRLRRRTSLLTRMAATALTEAAAGGGADLSTTRFVLVSSFGEISTTVDILEQLGDPSGPVSPTAFHNSVHNTATGYFSITSGNRRGSTALAAGPEGLAMGVLEVFMDLRDHGGDALLLIAEEHLPPPFATGETRLPLCLALHFASEPGRPEHADSVDLRVELLGRAATEGEQGPAPAGIAYTAAVVLPLLKALSRSLVQGSERAEPSAPREIPLQSHRDPGIAHRWVLQLAGPEGAAGEAWA